MIKIISPDQFKKIPWKNGKGETTELAISDGGTLADFDWRLSMASVVEDGEFSDFTGYSRNLALIAGGGIELQYGQAGVDMLEQILDFATFDGGCKTVGRLKSGPITDFNLIYKNNKYNVLFNTYTERQDVKLEPCSLCFIYCLSEVAGLGHEMGQPQVALLTSQDNAISIPLNGGHLMQLIDLDHDKLKVNGKNMIVIHLAS